MPRGMAMLLVVCATVLVAAGPGQLSVRGATVTAESIKEKENQIKQSKQERDALKSNMTDLQKVRNQLQASKNDLNAYVKELDGNLSDIQDKIDELAGKIETKEAEIKETEAELEATKALQEAQYEAMKKRIRFMYERSSNAYMTMLIESGSIHELLNRAEYISELSAYDRGKLDEYIQTGQMIELTKQELEEEKATLEEAKEAQAKEKASMQELINQKNQEIYGLTSDIKDKEAAIKEYEQSIAQENAEIAELEKIVAAEKAALAEQNRRKYDGGMFTFPCPSYTRISDNYGNRTHPILGTKQFHNGVDLAAPAGSPILAAYDGTVVAAAYSGTMGNYVMIDHGSGLYTIYMHASKLYVSKGAEVTKGQKIAAVGSTGRSTGNHLHFSVRLNGNYTSPWNYLK